MLDQVFFKYGSNMLHHLMVFVQKRYHLNKLNNILSEAVNKIIPFDFVSTLIDLLLPFRLNSSIIYAINTFTAAVVNDRGRSFILQSEKIHFLSQLRVDQCVNMRTRIVSYSTFKVLEPLLQYEGYLSLLLVQTSRTQVSSSSCVVSSDVFRERDCCYLRRESLKIVWFSTQSHTKISTITMVRIYLFFLSSMSCRFLLNLLHSERYSQAFPFMYKFKHS